MGLAYQILIYKNAEQFKRLFRSIYDEGNRYLIHVDRKSPTSYHEEIARFLKDYPRARIMRSHVHIWGGYRMVQLELLGMAELLQDTSWSHYFNLSGQDFPLMTQQEMRAQLAEDPNLNYIMCRSLRSEWTGWAARLERFCLEWNGHIRQTRFPRFFNRHIHPFGGSTWFTITRKMCEYFCYDTAAQRVIKSFRHTMIPEETAFATAAKAGPFCPEICTDNKRLILWDQPAGAHPRVLATADWPVITASNAFFARKFDPAVDSRVIDMLEGRLRSR